MATTRTSIGYVSERLAGTGNVPAKIFAFTALPNARSRRVMEKAGMRFVREFDHPAVPRGHPLARHALYRAKRAA